jgi:hypothetical protein
MQDFFLGLFSLTGIVDELAIFLKGPHFHDLVFQKIHQRDKVA